MLWTREPAVPARYTGPENQLLPSLNHLLSATLERCLLRHFLDDRVKGLPMHIPPVCIDTQIRHEKWLQIEVV